MFKNIIKSICWFSYYFFLQTFGMIGVFLFDLFTQRLTFSNLDDINVVMEELTTYLLAIAVPSLIVSSVLFILTFMLYKLIRKHKFDFKTVESHKASFMVCFGFTLNVLLSLILTIVISFLPKGLTDSLNLSTDLVLAGQPLWVLLLGTGILCPIMEELVFRYGICGTMARSNPKVALIVSSVIFGIVHGNVIQGVYATILGLIFGIIYLKYRNIWYPALIHMAINSSSVILSCLGLDWLMIIFLIVGVGGIVYLTNLHPELKDIFKKEPAKITENENEDPSFDSQNIL